MGPEWSPGPENGPPGMPRPFSPLWERSRGPKPPKYSPNSRSTAPGGRYCYPDIRSSFFENCRRVLKLNGVFVTQSESPEAFQKIHIEIVRLLREIFDHADPLYGNIPIYPSGLWSWTFASIGKPRYLNPITKRALEIADKCKFWSPRWQAGAFNAIPAFIDRELKNDI